MSSGGEERLVGLIAFGLVFWIFATLQRGLREARLPIGRAYVHRDERPGAFRALVGLYGAALLLVGFISLDLLFHISEKLGP